MFDVLKISRKNFYHFLGKFSTIGKNGPLLMCRVDYARLFLEHIERKNELEISKFRDKIHISPIFSRCTKHLKSRIVKHR